MKTSAKFDVSRAYRENRKKNTNQPINQSDNVYKVPRVVLLWKKKTKAKQNKQTNK